MANYKVKKTRIVCEHKEILPPITSIYITREGGYVNGKGQRLDYLGTSQVVGFETQVRFYDRASNETVTLPLKSLPRVQTWSGYTLRTGGHGSVLDSLFPTRHTVPAPARNAKPLPVEMKSENPILCKLCNLSHRVMPIHAAPASAK